MDREILFRGKRADNGEWVEGFYWKDIWADDAEYICYDGEDYEVIPETVGQYTGLTDKNKQKAFEHDCIRQHFGEDIGVIRYGEYTQPFNADKFTKHIGFYVDWISGKRKDTLRRDLGYWLNLVPIIGNIHDNPELLEVTERTGENGEEKI